MLILVRATAVASGCGGSAAVYSTPARAHIEYERAVAPTVLHCFVTFLRTSLKAGTTSGLVTTHVSPLVVGDEGSEVHVVVPLRYRGHAFTIYLDVGNYRITNATGSLSIVAWPREYPPGLFQSRARSPGRAWSSCASRNRLSHHRAACAGDKFSRSAQSLST
ncbi:MAG TPA: hypothetical protein VHS27_12615 [Gaiellales bacterium]|nr:hypothetical protein [Gaiellales bacterium]